MNWKKRSLSEKIFDSLNNAFMLFIILVIIIPFLYIIMASLTNTTNIYYMFTENTKISFAAYSTILNSGSMLFRSFFVSVGRVVFGTSLQLLVSCLLAYPLSKKNLPGRSGITIFLVITMIFNGGLVTKYIVVSATGLINKYLVYVLPALVSAWYAILLRNFFMTLPEPIFESAKIDGASDFLVLFKIVLPLSLPALATVGLFYAVNQWNSWFDAVLYMRDANKYPVQILLRRVVMEDLNLNNSTGEDALETMTPEAIKNAIVIITTLPIVLLYPFLQKYFIKGMIVGAIKG